MQVVLSGDMEAREQLPTELKASNALIMHCGSVPRDWSLMMFSWWTSADSPAGTAQSCSFLRCLHLLVLDANICTACSLLFCMPPSDCLQPLVLPAASCTACHHHTTCSLLSCPAASLPTAELSCACSAGAHSSPAALSHALTWHCHCSCFCGVMSADALRATIIPLMPFLSDISSDNSLLWRCSCRLLYLLQAQTGCVLLHLLESYEDTAKEIAKYVVASGKLHQQRWREAVMARCHAPTDSWRTQHCCGSSSTEQDSRWFGWCCCLLRASKGKLLQVRPITALPQCLLAVLSRAHQCSAVQSQPANEFDGRWLQGSDRLLAAPCTAFAFQHRQLQRHVGGLVASADQYHLPLGQRLSQHLPPGISAFKLLNSPQLLLLTC